MNTQHVLVSVALATGFLAGNGAALAKTPAQPTAAPSSAALSDADAARADAWAGPLRKGMHAPQVRALQVRLRHAKALAAYDATDEFGGRTLAAVRNFQKTGKLPVTGVVDRATWDALVAQTPVPTTAELNNTDIGPWFVSPDQSVFVMELQHRLRQVKAYDGATDGKLDAATKAAIASWRERIQLPVSEVMDERTWTRLLAKTHNPSYRQLFPDAPRSDFTQELDPRCLKGKVVCISKGQKRLSYVVDGQPLMTQEARFAMPGWDSPVGEFKVWYKNRDTVSKIFGERFPMPYAVFYSGNVAIHFSDDFAQKGYDSGSHGCSQLRDYQSMKWLYEQLKVGDRVVVYE